MQMMTSRPQNPPPPRLFFLDNIRSVVIVFVVLFHASLSYFKGCPWWYVRDAQRIPYLMNFIIFFDVTLMPILFFISGLLATSSYERHSASSFLKSKFKRLAVPLLVCTFLFSPIMPFVRQYLRAMGSGTRLTDFWDFWLQYIQSGSSLHAHPADQSTDLVVNQYWFLMLLFVFSVAFTLYREGVAKFGRKRTNHHAAGTPSRATIYVSLTVSGIIIGLVYSLTCNLISHSVWVTVGDLFQLQISKVPIYAAFFILGIVTHHRGWLEPLLQAGHPLTWLAVSSLVTFAYLTVVGLIPTAPGLLFIAYMLRIFVVLTVLIFSMSFFHRFMNRSTPVWRQLATNSYEIYLIHMVPQVLFQLLVLRWPISPLLKFGVVSALTLLLSYGVSRFLVRKSAYAGILGLVLLFLVMCVFF